ncbi:MAG: heparinase II/III family protein [bacterium]|nr:MAG: heparinase II/III family protein [bacterium]
MRWKYISAFLLLILINFCAYAGWQENKKHYPRLIYESSDLPIIRAHYEAAKQGVDPYKTLWARIQKTAYTALKFGVKDWGIQNVNGGVIKARALLYVLTGEQNHAAWVRDGLLSMYTGEEIPAFGINGLIFNLTPYKNLKTSVMQSIHMAQSLTQHCQAYDMLKGAGFDFGASETRIRDNIATLAERIYNISRWISSGVKAAELLQQDVEEQNNFQLKMMSALGLAAICLNDHRSAEKWINRAMTKFWQVFTAQTTSNGGYGEGPFYFLYSGLNFLPFFRAYNLFMDGQGGSFDGYKIPNFLSDEWVANVLDWHIKIRMPNGDRPGFDDGYYAAFISGLLASSPKMSGHATDHHSSADLGIYAWDWLNTEIMADGYDNRFLSSFANLDLTVDIFCVFDANIKPTEPSGSPTLFSPEAGNVVFRSGWDKNATYMLLLGEKNNMRIMGGVHEHPDAGSFVIYAQGELLALDSGYPGFPQHDLVNKAKNHSVILVDDQGPENIDAELGDFFDTPKLDFASVKMIYGGANIVRNVLFVDNEYFILIDEMEGELAHEFAWLLHGNASISFTNTTFIRTAKGGIWKRPRASLEAYVISDRGVPIYEVAEDYHSLRFVSRQGTLPKHAVLRVRQTSNKLRYLSILMPYLQRVKSPTISSVNARGGTCLKIERQNDFPTFCAVRGDVNLVSFGTNVAEMTTDGEIVLIQLFGRSDQPELIFARNMTSIRVGSEIVLSANQRCCITLIYDENEKIYFGEVQGPDNNYLSLKLAAKPIKVIGPKGFKFQPTSQTLQLEFDKPKPFRIEFKM